jgi:hypothetical protein
VEVELRNLMRSQATRYCCLKPMRVWAFTSSVLKIGSRSLMVLWYQSWEAVVGSLLNWLVVPHRLNYRLGLKDVSDESPG